MIAIVDYGRGNLGSVEKAFARVGMPAVVTEDPSVVDDAEAVVLPGDGAFHDAMSNLQRLGLLPAVRRAPASAMGVRPRFCLRGRAPGSSWWIARLISPSRRSR